MASPKIIDLDKIVEFDDAPIHTKPFRLLGREWTMVCDLNSFAITELTTGEPTAIVRFIDSVIIPAEREAFRTALATTPNLTAEKLSQILMALVEAASERPTTLPSASSRGAVKKTSPQKSVGSSSSRQVRR